jgi:hypothetical protein
MKMNTPTLLTLILLTTISAFAQQTEMKLKLSKGDIFEFNTGMNTNINQEMMGMKMEISQKYTTVFAFEVKEVLSNGDYLINQTYKRIVIEANTNGRILNYDSDNDETSSPLAAIGNLKGAVISYNLSPGGKVSEVNGLNEIGNKMGNNPQIKNMWKSIANDKLLESTFSYIPVEKVKAGTNYTKTIVMEEFLDAEIITKYNVESIDASSIHLNVFSEFDINPDKPIEQNGMKMEMKGEGSQTGTLKVSRSTGMPEETDTKQEIEMTITMKNPQTNEDITIPMKVDTTIKSTIKKK